LSRSRRRESGTRPVVWRAGPGWSELQGYDREKVLSDVRVCFVPAIFSRWMIRVKPVRTTPKPNAAAVTCRAKTRSASSRLDDPEILHASRIDWIGLRCPQAWQPTMTHGFHWKQISGRAPGGAPSRIRDGALCADESNTSRCRKIRNSGSPSVQTMAATANATTGINIVGCAIRPDCNRSASHPLKFRKN
jgi:hypothetical protein